MKPIQEVPQANAEWLDQASRLKEVVLDQLESIPEARRTFAPKQGEWSASGVVEHLILLEETIVGLWRQRLADVPYPKAGLKSWMIANMASLMVSKTNVRVPTVSELEPTGESSVEELRARWQVAREALVASLPKDPSAAWVLHPVFGPLSSDQMGRLLAAHLEHHLRHWPLPKG